MTTISVWPNTDAGGPPFRAVVGDEEATGSAPGEALDALLARTGPPKGFAVVILQSQGPDEFFPAEKLDRLADLMTRMRAARDAGRSLEPAALAELKELTAEEFRASAARCQAILKRQEA